MSKELLEEAEVALSGLKDFQRLTVDHVHSHLFAANSSRRFLVADEVGLGKTLVARGVVARAIQTLSSSVERIDVVYICSNADIARQNINRLRVGRDRVALDTRLTLLPRHIRELKDSKSRLNFIAFTPSTSFDLKGGLGRSDERALIYLMLRELWDLRSRAAPLNVLRGNSGIDSFRRRIDEEDLEAIDPSLDSTRAFGDQLGRYDEAARREGRPTLRQEFDDLCAEYPQARSSPSDEVATRRSRWVGEVRGLLAASCLSALEPDLVILDEFQRFPQLLERGSEESDLAQQLFSINDVKVLLLSATPYRMYTPPGDGSVDDHYEDFVRTVDFLERNGKPETSIRPLLTDYREALIDLGLVGKAERLQAAATRLEERLRRVMVRTERLASTADRNGMLVEVAHPPTTVTADDALGYVALKRIANAVDHHDPVEYWKSAPYPLSFMGRDDYALSRGIDDVRSDPSSRVEVARALAAPGNHRLDVKRLGAQESVDPGNARLRVLLDETIGRGAHRLLWLPPALPYYRPRGVFAEQPLQTFTKRLVFTSWQFVPRAIAGLVSYEAERRMLGDRAPRRSGRGLLRFSTDEGRLTGMPVLAMMYPSSFLARACDPLVLSRAVASEGREPDSQSVLEIAREAISVTLAKRLKHAPAEGPVDQRWYWAAPLLLDMALEPDATRAWFGRQNLAGEWAGGDDEDGGAAWAAHVEEARRMALGSPTELGRRPDDLADVLAELGLGGPGPCLLRSMLRVVGLKTDALTSDMGQAIRTSAAAAAFAFRSLYNQPEITELLQREAGAGLVDEAFWRVAVRYGVDGNLQSVLDEYAHVLRDHLGLVGGSGAEKVHEIAEHMQQALSLRTATLSVRDVRASASALTIEEGDPHRLRCHFAVRFGDQVSDDGQHTTRADQVRRAFNSPFWPFVLATTSVGQEGLDFHPYCHAVVHWNLPTNPVDLEQREGRVHRYKGHAVRRNVAAGYGRAVMGAEDFDVWEALFERAFRERPPEATDLVPFWVFAHPDGARIERHVLTLPSSREHERRDELFRALAMYRMVFGQPRQEDMVRFLAERLRPEDLERFLHTSAIDLSPLPAQG